MAMKTTAKIQITGEGLEKHIRQTKGGVVAGIAMTGLCALGVRLCVYLQNHSPMLSLDWHQIWQSTKQLATNIPIFSGNKPQYVMTPQDGFTAIFDSFTIPLPFLIVATTQTMFDLRTANKDLKRLRRAEN
jgi:hypothetical protein